MAGDVKKDHLGVGAVQPGEVTSEDDIYEQYKKRMMLGYRYRPNPLVYWLLLPAFVSFQLFSLFLKLLPFCRTIQGKHTTDASEFIWGGDVRHQFLLHFCSQN
jgi:hypothetical protein